MKNWKTTVMGTVAGIFGAILTGFSNGSFEMNWKSFGAFAILTIWGVVMKDHDTTGNGTTATKQKGL